jgi:hypothetical protein
MAVIDRLPQGGLFNASKFGRKDAAGGERRFVSIPVRQGWGKQSFNVGHGNQ